MAMLEPGAPRFGESEAATRGEEFILNMGPQHPSTHGVLRLVMTLEGETIIRCTPIIGYLHRGMEKVLENRTYMQGIRYLDNSEYLSPMICESAYVGAVEQLMEVAPPRRGQMLRVIVSEMQRIASHLVAVGTYLPIWELSPPSCMPSATARASSNSSKRSRAAASR